MKRYAVVATKQYKKDYKILCRTGHDLQKLDHVIDTLAAGKELQVTHRDHALKGKLLGTRECHIGPDWLLRYAKDEDRLVLLLIQTGDHRKVLGIE
ncbi:MAG: type II toxin-antitoxin system YafQ family toxin [Candidatus Peribacteraceae bacterium]|nr:type II toxin-antitoxin system YafQ family toxin [Candidatus Peribacteraceae bacterium]MDD5739479.1 type II toxin-antitoxin system YafQ family toxin [Candidatus Peribacteraceae bacterium]